jgi:hypothetical protein
MASVADFASEFARRAANGKKTSIFVSKQHLESFLLVLAREGMMFAQECLGRISDPEMRKIVETIFFSTAAGAVSGACIGGILGGPPGAQVGALVGASFGFAAGCVAVTITASQRGNGLVLSAA